MAQGRDWSLADQFSCNVTTRVRACLTKRTEDHGLTNVENRGRNTNSLLGETVLVAISNFSVRPATATRNAYPSPQRTQANSEDIGECVTAAAVPHRAPPCSFSARRIFSGVNGISSMRTPTASKIALAMAGMGGVEHISPTPLPP